MRTNSVDASRFEHCATPLQLNETDMEECTPPASFDYFSGSEVSYALTFTFFGLFIIGLCSEYEILI